MSDPRPFRIDRPRVQPLAIAMLAVALIAVTGCNDPLSRDSTDDLRRQVIEAHRRQLADLAEADPTPLAPGKSDSYIDSEYIAREANQIDGKSIDEWSGPGSYRAASLDIGTGLDGQASGTAMLTLEQAVRLTVRNNLDVALARLAPAVSEAELARAEAIFDAVFFTNVSGGNVDQPRIVPIVGGIPVSTAVTQSDTASLETGIRKPLETGGQVTVSTSLDYSNNKTPGFGAAPDPGYTSNVFLGFEQPLLRNFGTAINRAQIALTANAHQRDVLALQDQLLQSVADVEVAYWNLSFARYRLAIQQQLLKLTIETRDKIKKRQEFDASPIQRAQSQAFVDSRRQSLIRARQDVREASDELKRLMNDPSLPVSGETLLVPADEPVDAALTYSLLDEVTTALNKRPQVRQALINIDDSSIRQKVADNQRLPILNLNASVNYHGLDDRATQSYNRIADGEFIDYIVGGQFEAPIGNRAAEADFRRTRVQRQIAVVQYQQAAQSAVVSVKAALREIDASYEVINHARASRRSFAENLRALLVLEEEGEALTPEFLQLKLDTQQRLADSETSELQSVINYNIALARLHEATGTLLERNQIDFESPTLHKK